MLEVIPAIALLAGGAPRTAALAGIAVLRLARRRPARRTAVPATALALGVAFAAGALPRRAGAAARLAPAGATLVLLAVALPLAAAFQYRSGRLRGAFHAASDASAGAVWAAEQHRRGLEAAVSAGGLLRATPLLGCLLLGVAAAQTASAGVSRNGVGGIGVTEGARRSPS